MNFITEIKFQSFKQNVPEILDQCRLADDLKKKRPDKIILKPNLTINQPHPCTTHPELVEQVIIYLRRQSAPPIVIAEGSGGCDTNLAFEQLGYQRLAEKYGVELIDLNRIRRVNRRLPEIFFTGRPYIINLPVAKNHSAVSFTGCLKNLVGCYVNENPEKALDRHWLKSDLHRLNLHHVILDLNRYIKVNFHLLDASIGQINGEVDGAPCQPPLGKLLAGYDGRALDRAACRLFGYNPDEIEYLSQ